MFAKTGFAWNNIEFPDKYIVDRNRSGAKQNVQKLLPNRPQYNYPELYDLTRVEQGFGIVKRAKDIKINDLRNI